MVGQKLDKQNLNYIMTALSIVCGISVSVIGILWFFERFDGDFIGVMLHIYLV